MIRWSEKDPTTVERAIQMLLRRQFPAAQAIDGSGGDDGQDVRWESPDGLVIFEIKSFTALLTTAQKRQIVRSLSTAAAADSPVRWVLIMPRRPTPGELRWFDQIVGPTTPRIVLEWWGQDWLDGQFAAHEDLRRFVEGNDYGLLERAKEMGLEQAVLVNGVSDLVKRQNVLNERANELSPYWTVRPERTPCGPGFAFYEKFPGAALEDPISFTPTLYFDPEDASHIELREQLQHVLRFGGQVRIPGANVTGFEISASEATRRLFGQGHEGFVGGDIEIISPPSTEGLPLHAQLVLLAEDGLWNIESELPITFDQRVVGNAGATLLGRDPSGLLKVELVVPGNPELTDGAAFQFSLGATAGKRPDVLLPTLRLLGASRRGQRFGLKIGPIRVAASEPLGSLAGESSWLKDIYELVAVLDRLQTHCGVILPIPADFSPGDAQTWSSLVAVLDGEQVLVPTQSITMQVREGQLREFLARTPEQGQAIYVTTDTFINVGDVNCRFGMVGLYCPHVVLENRQSLEKRVDQPGPAEAVFAAADDKSFYWTPVGTAPDAAAACN